MNRPNALGCIALASSGFIACATAQAAGDALSAASPVPVTSQGALVPVINAGERLLRFNWPAIRIGTGEYEEGPTGVTVFYFPNRMTATVDVRGGGPATVNTDYLRQGYEAQRIDAVVFAGGSAYGLEAATAVASAMKDDGVRDGTYDGVALATGAIIYDFGGRLNEVYPDKRLAQAAFRAARTGVFPLGAQGAGRFARNGGLFGCNVYSGQGGAFRQVGELKVAAFVVVNAAGIVTDREGRAAACYRDRDWPADLRTADLLARSPAIRRGGWPAAEPRGNTTISLVVTNRKLRPAQLQRLAAEVHTSMARAIQPFATEFDGDALFAVSTSEIDAPPNPLEALDLDMLASELMWDAVLAAIPEQPVATAPVAGAPAPAAADLRRYAGDYLFGPGVCLHVEAVGTRITAIAAGARPVYAIGRNAPTELQPLSQTDFAVPGRYPLTLHFDGSGIIVNPGHWAQRGVRQPRCERATGAG